jgi:hypothetical protein
VRKAQAGFDLKVSSPGYLRAFDVSVFFFNRSDQRQNFRSSRDPLYQPSTDLDSPSLVAVSAIAGFWLTCELVDQLAETHQAIEMMKPLENEVLEPPTPLGQSQLTLFPAFQVLAKPQYFPFSEFARCAQQSGHFSFLETIAKIAPTNCSAMG